MTQYRKRPIVIEARQWDGDHEAFFADPAFQECLPEIWSMGPHTSMIIPTLEGRMRADVGDWIIKGVNGEFYPCKDDIFRKTYDPVEG